MPLANIDPHQLAALLGGSNYGPHIMGALGPGNVPPIQATYAGGPSPMLGLPPASSFAEAVPQATTAANVAQGRAATDLSRFTLGESDMTNGPAAQAGKGLGGFLARTPWTTAAEGSGGPGMLAAGSALGPGSIGRGVGYGIAGQVGSGILRSALGGERDGKWDNAAEGAIGGAGAGAGIGSMIAPGIGTAVGGGVGAVAGGLWGWLHGKDSNAKQVRGEVGKQNSALTPFLSKLSPEAQSQLTTQLGIMAQQFTKPEDVKAAYAQVAQSIPQVLAQEQQQRQQLNNMLAMQSIVGPQFDQFLKGLGANQKAFADTQGQFADSLSGSPAIGASIKANAAQSVLSNSATAAAYKSQIDGRTTAMAAQIGAPQSIVDQLRQQYG